MVSEDRQAPKFHDKDCNCPECFIWFRTPKGDGHCPWCRRELDDHKDALACQPEGVR